MEIAPQRIPVRRIVLLWISWAVLILGFQHIVTARFSLERPDRVLAWTAEQTGVDSQSDKPYLSDPFLNEHVSFDSEFYLSIALEGYDDPKVRTVRHENTAYSLNYGYFPLYPMLIRGVTLPLRIFPLRPVAAATLAGVLVSLGATLLAMVSLYDLARPRLGDDGAMRAVYYLLVFPSGFFLAQVFSEALFAGLAFASLALMARRRHLAAAGLAALAVLTRGAGPALCAALVVSVLVCEANGSLFRPSSYSWPTLARAGSYALIPAAAFGVWVLRFGEAFAFLEDHFYGGRAMPPRIFEALSNWMGAASTLLGRGTFWHMGDPRQAAIYYAIELGGLGLGLFASLATLRDFPAAAAFSLAAFGIATFSNIPHSAIRYMLVLPSIPLFLARLGRVLLFDRVWSLASILLMGMLTILFSFDFWVA